MKPNGLANWHQGKVRLEKGYNAVLCARISKEKAGWAGESECTSTFEPVGSVEWWQWGTEWAAYDPLHASGLQANQTGNAEEIWNWFYEP